MQVVRAVLVEEVLMYGKSTSILGHRHQGFFYALFFVILYLIWCPFSSASVGNVHHSAHASEPAGESSHSPENPVEGLLRSLVHPVDAPSFTIETGEVYHLKSVPRYKSPLGKRVLVLDIDSRPMTNAGGGVFHKAALKWQGLDPMAAGILSHHLYAKIHGYDYQFIRAPKYADRGETWPKVPMLKKALESHEIVVFLDQDAMFHYPTLPLEWLLNYWNHTAETRLMLAIDPDREHNGDRDGDLYPGCGRYAYVMPREQASLVGFLKKSDFSDPEDISGSPCAEANGSPVMSESQGCEGVFLRHFWMDAKKYPTVELGEGLLRYIIPAMRTMLDLPSAYSDLEKYTDDLCAFIKTPLVRQITGGIHVNDALIHNAWESLPTEWTEWWARWPDHRLAQQDLIDKIDEDAGINPADELLRARPESLGKWLSQLKALALARTQRPGPTVVFPEVLETRMKTKKIAEVARATHLIYEMCESRGINRVVDMGSGQGYLSISLAYLFPKLQVLAIDGSESQVAGSQAFADALGIPQSRLKHMVHWIDGSSTLADKVQDWAAGEKCILVGLHACGNLSEHMIRYFATIPGMDALAVTGFPSAPPCETEMSH
ncbi:hypothetical protein NLG97_g7300 [Lecanicillium saksenae]|uniref:Uncharacterized protein n=1 Tax=Lecanicillium saksenae TaxID=468837 RepID=A0ACC1QR15_9HYPO|nr:hypothetical protein NLG97_g7300 [Lecanicillium saksenae]